MHAPTLTSETTRELAQLRSRAYGPDADIDRDAHALARLIELEDSARSDAAASVSAKEPHEPATTGSPTATVVEESADDNGAGQVTAGSPAPLHWWRRVPVVAFVGAAAIVGLAVGLAVPALAAPRPVATLQPASLDGAQLDFEMYGIRSDSQVRYEPYRDLEVWSAQTEDGSTCIVVTTAGSEWMTAGCSPEPLDPVADIPFSTGMRAIEGLDLPPGSIVRFILRDDAMEVWIAETAHDA